ncbi:hypothetical protein JOQ06_003986 [Pogonophryne albipinna]|uniref:Orn/DAP/Arg decarboxylase 2 C-terminal domain-containing protein n=1 Tax=Pogonophryne albipinna TaxID=1090488 RepID=A0AAD6F6U3_9TELE|nr:hypothetical protein JOQ06_003986 [Pogonophryne albipinna]
MNFFYFYILLLRLLSYFSKRSHYPQNLSDVFNPLLTNPCYSSPAALNGSTLQDFSSGDVHVLDDGRSINDFIDDQIKTLQSESVMGVQMSLLDIGGGFSGRDNFQVKFEEFSEVINAALDKFFPPDCGVQIIAEPGRFYVESAFTLAVNVIAKKNCEESGPGGQIMYYINDGVYGSLSCIFNDPAHPPVQLLPHRAVGVGEVRYRSVVWGPTCDSLDKVSDSAMIPELQVGDWLLVHHMGAYTVSLSTDFNGFERAKVFPVVTEETRRLLELRHTSA